MGKVLVKNVCLKERKDIFTTLMVREMSAKQRWQEARARKKKKINNLFSFSFFIIFLFIIFEFVFGFVLC